MSKSYTNKAAAMIIMGLSVHVSLYACIPTAVIDIQTYELGDREVEIEVGDSLTFKGDRSHDNDDNGERIVSHYWYVWEDGASQPIYPNYDYSTGSIDFKKIQFDSAGTYKVKLQVRDEEMNLSSNYKNYLNSCTIIVSNTDPNTDPIIVNNELPDVQVDGDVILNGTVLYDSGQTPMMKVYYGTSDGFWSGETGWITTVNGNGEFSSEEISGLIPGWRYYFRSYGRYVSHPSNDWDETATHNNPNPILFITAPGQANCVSPNHGSTGVPFYTNISWTEGQHNSSYPIAKHEVFFGLHGGSLTLYDTVLNGEALECDLPLLEFGTQYDWRIDEIIIDTYNGQAERRRAGKVWTFTTEPLNPDYLPVIENRQVDGINNDSAVIHGELVTTGTDQDCTVKVCWGSEYGGDVLENWDHSETVHNAHTGGDCLYSLTDVLAPGSLYYFRFYAEQNTYELYDWADIDSNTSYRFYTAPGYASGPSPTGSNITITPLLTWTAGASGRAVEHDVYLGTDINAVLNATHESEEYVGRFTESEYDPGRLECNTTYYWRVDEVVYDEYNEVERISKYPWWAEDPWSFATVPNHFMPSSPTKVRAYAEDHLVNIIWAQQDGAIGYNVYRSPSEGGPYGKVNSTLVGAYPGYGDNTAQNGNTYYYVVTAVDAEGFESKYSQEVSAAPEASLPPIVFVDDDAPAGGNGSVTWPYQTVYAGITNVSNPGVVLIREGDYPESYSYVAVPRDVDVQGEDPSDWEVIDSTVIRNIRLNLCDYNGYVCGLTIRDCEQGAVYVETTSPYHTSIKNCSFIENTSVDGGAISVWHTDYVHIEGCKFIENTSYNDGNRTYGGAFDSYYSYPDIYNCVFIDNYAIADSVENEMGNAIAFESSYPVLIGCTILDDSWDGQKIYLTETQMDIWNCILWTSYWWGMDQARIEHNSSINFDYCCLPDNSVLADGTSTYSFGAKVINPANPGFDSNTGRLLQGSPCIDAGINGQVIGDTDCDGHPRKVDDWNTTDTGYGSVPLVDIGAYEYGSDPKVPVYVDKDAPGDNNGTSWEDAYTSLQDGIRAAEARGDGFEVWVADGVYTPDLGSEITLGDRNASFTINKDIIIRGGYGGYAQYYYGLTYDPDCRNLRIYETILSGDLNGDDDSVGIEENAYHVVTVAGGVNAAMLLEGVTVSGGNPDGAVSEVGGGIYCNGDPTIQDCIITGNSLRSFYTSGSGNPTLIRCEIRDNEGGIQANGSITCQGCLFEHNTTSESGGGVFNAAVGSVFENCIFRENTAISGGALYTTADGVTIRHCTFYGNVASWASSDGGAVYSVGASTNVYIRNSIFWNNSGLDIAGNGSVYYVSYSCVEDGFLGDGNIDQNPLFISSDDYHLQQGSPCVDAGSNTSAQGIDSDYDGRDRCVDGNMDGSAGVDMGAYERGLTLYVDQSRPDGGEGMSWADAFSDLQGALIRGQQKDVQEIVITEGVYTPHTSNRASSFELPEGVALYGGFPSGGGSWMQRNPEIHETVLSGDLFDNDEIDYEGTRVHVDDNSYRILTGQDKAVLDGLTILGGYADFNSEEITEYNKGAALYAVDVTMTLRNCRVLYNSAYGSAGGDAVYSKNSVLTFINCEFAHNNLNSWTRGGALYLYGSKCMINQCTFYKNNGSAVYAIVDSKVDVRNSQYYKNHSSGEGGGAISTRDSDLTIRDCTFDSNLDNYAESSGGGAVNFSLTVDTNPVKKIEIADTIFVNNSAGSDDNGGALQISGYWDINTSLMEAAITNCVFAFNTSGEGGALSIQGGMVLSSQVQNCLFYQNSAVAYGYYHPTPCGQGGAIYSDAYLQAGSAVDFINCTFAQNNANDSGGAVYLNDYSSDYFSFTNSIFWGNTAGVEYPDIEYAGTVSPVLTNCCIESGWSGQISDDPRFVNIDEACGPDGQWFTEDDGLRLLPDSPCVDKIDDTEAPAEDISGISRVDIPYAANPGGTISDMGAYEAMLVWFVRWNASGGNTGTSWQNAYTDLQNAIAQAQIYGGDIWVGEGVYCPSDTLDQADSFHLVDNVAIYGGFKGNQTVRTLRCPENHPTILSGDLSGDDDISVPVDDPLRNSDENSYHVVRSDSNTDTAVLDGFVIRGGYADSSETEGGGLYISGSGSPQIINCIFEENYASDKGGAVSVYSSGTPELRNCRFIGNMSSQGGGIYDHGDGVLLVHECDFISNSVDEIGGGVCITQAETQLKDCLFQGNSAYQSGGGLYLSSSEAMITDCLFIENSVTMSCGGGIRGYFSNYTLTNSVFYGNTATLYGGALENYISSPQISNCTITANEAGYGGGISNRVSSSCVLKNSIVWGNISGSTNGSLNELFNLVSQPKIAYSNIKGSNGSGEDWTAALGIDEGGNIDVDPVFMDPDHPAGEDGRYATADDGLRPLCYDPTNGGYEDDFPGSCLDSADNDFALPEDITGQKRLDVTYLPNKGHGQKTYVDMGAYESRPVWYVVHPDDAPTQGKGYSWQYPLTDLKKAIEKALAGDEIWVAKGIFKPGDPEDDQVDWDNDPDKYNNTPSFILKEPVDMYGGFAGTETSPALRDWAGNATVLSGKETFTCIHTSDGYEEIGNSYHVVISSVDQVKIDGFTIQDSEGPFSHDQVGGGIWNTGDIILRNCTFQDNVIGKGAGMYNYDCSLELRNCIFRNNRSSTSGYGGALYLDQVNAIIEECCFEENSSAFGTGLGGYGGAVYITNTNEDVNCSSGVVNCTFTRNRSGYGGAICCSQDSTDTRVLTDVQIINGVFLDNESIAGGGVHVADYCTVDILNCTFTLNSSTSYGGALYLENNSKPVRLNNSIVWNNPGSGSIRLGSTYDFEANYCDINGCGTLPGTGTFNDDPEFRNVASGDLTLLSGSPCIDTGSNDLLLPDTADLDRDGLMNEPVPLDIKNELRIQNGDLSDPAEVIDRGAYEFSGIVVYDQTGANAIVTDEDISVEFTLDAVDADGAALTYEIIDGPDHGSIVTVDGITVMYQGDPDYNGTDSFTYIVYDGQGSSTIATVEIQVTAVEEPPRALDDLAWINIGESQIEIDILKNDYDPDFDISDIVVFDSIVTQPVQGGTLDTSTTAIDGKVTFTKGSSLPDTFVYQIVDLNSNPATAQVTVQLNNPPTPVVDEGLVTEENILLPIPYSILIQNDTDPDGHAILMDPESWDDTSALGGQVAYSSTYDVFFYLPPDIDWSAVPDRTDSFTYWVQDEFGGVEQAVAAIVVYENTTILDTDQDYISDWDEIYNFNTNYTLQDTDDDGVTDCEELMSGTDPLSKYKGSHYADPLPYSTSFGYAKDRVWFDEDWEEIENFQGYSEENLDRQYGWESSSNCYLTQKLHPNLLFRGYTEYYVYEGYVAVVEVDPGGYVKKTFIDEGDEHTSVKAELAPVAGVEFKIIANDGVNDNILAAVKFVENGLDPNRMDVHVWDGTDYILSDQTIDQCVEYITAIENFIPIKLIEVEFRMNYGASDNTYQLWLNEANPGLEFPPGLYMPGYGDIGWYYSIPQDIDGTNWVFRQGWFAPTQILVKSFDGTQDTFNFAADSEVLSSVEFTVTETSLAPMFLNRIFIEDPSAGGFCMCGNGQTSHIDGAAYAAITWPCSCHSTNESLVPIKGEIWWDHLGKYVLQYRPTPEYGEEAATYDWVTFAEGTNIVKRQSDCHEGGGILGYWDTSALPNGSYDIRLLVFSDVMMYYIYWDIEDYPWPYPMDLGLSPEYCWIEQVEVTGNQKSQTFTYQEEPDMQVNWPGKFPFDFVRSYDSNRKDDDTPLYWGWSHNHYMTIQEDTVNYQDQAFDIVQSLLYGDKGEGINYGAAYGLIWVTYPGGGRQLFVHVSRDMTSAEQFWRYSRYAGDPGISSFYDDYGEGDAVYYPVTRMQTDSDGDESADDAEIIRDKNREYIVRRTNTVPRGADSYDIREIQYVLKYRDGTEYVFVVDQQDDFEENQWPSNYVTSAIYQWVTKPIGCRSKSDIYGNTLLYEWERGDEDQPILTEIRYDACGDGTDFDHDSDDITIQLELDGEYYTEAVLKVGPDTKQKVEYELIYSENYGYWDIELLDYYYEIGQYLLGIDYQMLEEDYQAGQYILKVTKSSDDGVVDTEGVLSNPKVEVMKYDMGPRYNMDVLLNGYFNSIPMSAIYKDNKLFLWVEYDNVGNVVKRIDFTDHDGYVLHKKDYTYTYYEKDEFNPDIFHLHTRESDPFTISDVIQNEKGEMLFQYIRAKDGTPAKHTEYSYESSDPPFKPNMIVEYFDGLEADGSDQVIRRTENDYQEEGVPFNLTRDIYEQKVYDDITGELLSVMNQEYYDYAPISLTDKAYHFTAMKIAWQELSQDSDLHEKPSITAYEYGPYTGSYDQIPSPEDRYLRKEIQLLNVGPLPGLSDGDEEYAVTEFTYHENGRLLTKTDPRGTITEYFYDSNWHPEMVKINGTVVERYCCDALGQKLLEANAMGAVTRNDYDGLGRLYKVRTYSDPDAMVRPSFTPQDYDSLSWLTQTVYGYDAWGKKTYEKMTYNQDDPQAEIATRTEYTTTGLPWLVIKDNENGDDEDDSFIYYAYDPRGLQVMSFSWDATAEKWWYTDDYYDGLGQKRAHLAWDYMDKEILSATLMGYYGSGKKAYQDIWGPKGDGEYSRQGITDYRYDPMDRMIEEIVTYEYIDEENKSGSSTKYGYDDIGNKLYSIDPKGNITFFDYDNANRKIMSYYTRPIVEDPLLTFDEEVEVARLAAVKRQEYEYYPNNSVESLTVFEDDDPTHTVLQQTSFDYDSRKRVIYVAEDIDGTQLAETYIDYKDASERDPVTDFYVEGQYYQIRITDAESKYTYRQLDSAGNVTRVRYPSGDKEVQTYWGDGKLKSKTVWQSQTPCQITYTYDIYGNLEYVNYPDSGYLLYQYDDFRHRLKVEDYRNSQDNIGGTSRITYDVDALGRIRQVTDQDGYVTVYNYRADNQKALVEVISPENPDQKIYSVGYQYDKAGRLTDILEPLKPVGSQTLAMVDYDDNGNRSHLTYALTGQTDGPLVDVEYSYNLQNFLTKVTTTGGPAFTFGGTAGSGGDEAMIDGLGRLCRAEEVLTNAQGQSVTYTYGGNNPDDVITYDRRSQLLHEAIDKNSTPLWSGTFSYDSDGNLDNRTVTPFVQTNFTYQGDQMTSAIGGENFTLDWDLNGNMILRALTTIDYNWDNRLRSAQTGTNSISVQYDADGNRVRKQSSITGRRKYIMDLSGGLPVLLLEIDPGLNPGEASDDTVMKSYIHADSQILVQYDGGSSADKYFYLHDRLGSVKQVIDTSGDVKNRYVYEPFGIEIAGETEENVSNPFRFTGQFFDSEINQYHLRARQYDPSVYGFTTRDPVRGKYTEPLTLHKYLYCNNNPVNKIDISGKYSVLADVLISQAILNNLRKLDAKFCKKLLDKSTDMAQLINAWQFSRTMDMMRLYESMEKTAFKGIGADALRSIWDNWMGDFASLGGHFASAVYHMGDAILQSVDAGEKFYEFLYGDSEERSKIIIEELYQ